MGNHNRASLASLSCFSQNSNAYNLSSNENITLAKTTQNDSFWHNLSCIQFSLQLKASWIFQNCKAAIYECDVQTERTLISIRSIAYIMWPILLARYNNSTETEIKLQGGHLWIWCMYMVYSELQLCSKTCTKRVICQSPLFIVNSTYIKRSPFIKPT